MWWIKIGHAFFNVPPSEGSGPCPLPWNWTRLWWHWLKDQFSRSSPKGIGSSHFLPLQSLVLGNHLPCRKSDYRDTTKLRLLSCLQSHCRTTCCVERKAAEEVRCWTMNAEPISEMGLPASAMNQKQITSPVLHNTLTQKTESYIKCLYKPLNFNTLPCSNYPNVIGMELQVN